MPLKDNHPSQGELLQRIVQRTFWLFYDHIWLWCGVGLIAYSLSFTLILMPLVIAPLFQMASFALKQNYTQLNVKRFLKLILHPNLKALAYMIGILVLILAFIATFQFYMRLPQNMIWLKILSSSVVFWVVVTIAMMIPTLLSLWSTETDLGWWTTWKYAFFGLMAYPLLSIGTLGFFCILTLFCAVSLVGLVVIWMPLSVLLWYNLFYVVFVDSKNDFEETIEGLDDRFWCELFSVS